MADIILDGGNFTTNTGVAADPCGVSGGDFTTGAESTSPLLSYINARILVPSQGAVSLVNGRWTEAAGDSYLVRCFLKRAQYSGVSSGSKLVPIPSQLNGEMLPGASGDQFYYRGYALDYATVDNSWDLSISNEVALSWSQVTMQYSWLATGTECQFRFGQDPIMPAAKIQRSSGQYGGLGIDEIIYAQIGGVELQLTGSELQN